MSIATSLPTHLRDSFVAWLGDQAGQGMAEYALILALVAAVVIVALTSVGTSVTGLIGNVAGSF